MDLAILTLTSADFIIDFIFSESVCLILKIPAFKSVFIVSFVFCLMFSWYFIRDYYNINNPAIIKVGQEANRVIPEGSKVIAPYGGDTSFLYQTKRSWWPVFDRSLPELIDAGAGYLILLNPTIGELKDFGIYETISEGSDFVIFKLVQ